MATTWRRYFSDRLERDQKLAEAVEERECLGAFFARLAALRDASGVSREELAKLMGISPGQVEQLEAGIPDPRLSTLQNWVGALGLQLRLSTFHNPRL